MTLETTADIVTLLAFAVTIVTAVYVFFIDQKVKYISNLLKLFQRLEEQLADLKKEAAKLKKYSREMAEDQLQLQEIVNTISAICHNIEKKTKRQGQIEFLGLKEVIQTCRDLSERDISKKDVGDFMVI